MVAVLLAVDLLFLIIVTVWRLRLTERLVSRDVCALRLVAEALCMKK